MKNALLITTIGGFVPQFEMNDVKILQENGYTVHYASDFDNPVYRIDQKELNAKGLILHHIDIRKSPFRLKDNMKAFLQLRKIMKEEQIGLVHCHNPMGGVVGRLAAGFSGQRPYVIYTAHGFHFYEGAPWKNWLLFYTAEKFLARFTDRLITINKEDYERAKKFRLRKNGGVERIPGVGVDIIKFREKEELRQSRRKELKIPENGFHIVSVGELNDNKNHEIILEAIKRIDRRDIYYSICGKGNARERLYELIRKYQLSGQVQLLGYRTDISDILQSADCFAFPSKREGLGIAAIEAMACGIPLIASDNRGTREYMQYGRNGIICHTRNPEEFARAICQLKNAPELRKKMTQNCRETAKKFSIEATDKIMRRIYGEISRQQERM